MPFYHDGVEVEYDERLGQTGDDIYTRHLGREPIDFGDMYGFHIVPMDDDDLSLEVYLEDEDD